MQNTLLYKTAIVCYGVDAQIEQAIEECAELIVALKHYKKKKANKPSVITEIADVKVMMSQLALIFGAKDVKEECEFKRIRQLRRMLKAKQISYELFQEIGEGISAEDEGK